MSVGGVVGTLGWAVACAWLAIAAAPRVAPVRVLLAAGASSVLLAGPYLRGAFSDLSITSVVIAAAAIAAHFGRRDWLSLRELLPTFWGVLICAFLFYPMALGLGPFDPYDLGYRSPWIVLLLGLLAVLAWSQGLRLPVLCLAAALSAFALGALESDNIWDYVIDPFLVIAAVIRTPWKRRTEPSG